MKIAQYIMGEEIRLGIIENDKLMPIRFDGDMVDFMKAGKPAETAGDPLPLDEIQLAAPVTRPSKIIAIGLNYRDHAEENKMEIPENPIVFAKFSSSLLEPNGAITWNEAVSRKVDFEAEMAVISVKRSMGVLKRMQIKRYSGIPAPMTSAQGISSARMGNGSGENL